MPTSHPRTISSPDLLEHVEASQSADLQLVALAAQALATVALVHVVTELAQALIDREA
jgi:hypothetical protein